MDDAIHTSQCAEHACVVTRLNVEGGKVYGHDTR